LAKNFFFSISKKKYLQFCEICGYKKGMTTNFFHPSLLFLFLDPGSGTGKKSGSGIRDKHPGFATLFTRGSNTRLKIMYLFMAMMAWYQRFLQLRIHHPLANSHNTGGYLAGTLTLFRTGGI
jgi:hypothetical protein